MLACVAAAYPSVVERAVPSDPFTLYAYSEEGAISGLPVFYSDGKTLFSPVALFLEAGLTYCLGSAFIGDYKQVGDSDASQVICKSPLASPLSYYTDSSSVSAGPNESLLGNPSKSSDTAPSWSNVTYYLPSPTSKSHRTGFSKSGETKDTVSTDFLFYGPTAMHSGRKGLETLWSATPASVDGVWELSWNQTSNDEASPVTLRTVPPTSDSSD